MKLTVKGACEECRNMGWAVFNDNEAQACDTCNVFEYDSDAFAHAIGLAIQILKINKSLVDTNSDHASRMHEVIRALKIVVDNAELIQTSVKDTAAYPSIESIDSMSPDNIWATYVGNQSVVEFVANSTGQDVWSMAVEYTDNSDYTQNFHIKSRQAIARKLVEHIANSKVVP